MGYISCLNLLERPDVFIPTAALLALVLLVWVELHVLGGGERNARVHVNCGRGGRNFNVHVHDGREGRNINWFCGVAWAYLGILSALTAVALFINNPTSACAKGFLILSFFMTGINIFILFLRNIAPLLWRGFSREPFRESLLGEFGRSRLCGLLWLATLFGLVLISFSPSLLGVRFCWFLQFIMGLKLVKAAGTKCYHCIFIAAFWLNAFGQN